MRSPLLACLVLFCAAILRATDVPAMDQAALVRSARAAQNAAIARHDLPAIASYWTDNVTICRGLGLQVSGKADYLALFKADDPATSLVYERIPDEVVVGMDWPLAFETGHWVGRRGGEAQLSGRYSAQWVRDGARWLIRGEVYVALEGNGDGKKLASAPAANVADSVATTAPAAIRELLTDFLTHNSDPARHEAFWADDVVYTSALGVVRTKAELLGTVHHATAAAKTPAGPAPTYTAEDIVIRPNHGFAALTFRLVVRNGDGTIDNYRNSGTLVFRDGRWQVITWQATKVAPSEKK